MRLLPLVLILLLVPAVQANENQACTGADIRGYYGVSCDGWATPPFPNATLVPFALAGTVTIDGRGAATGPATASLGGSAMSVVVTGKAVVQPDCTGTVSYDQRIEGQPGPKLNIHFIVLEEGKEMQGMSVDPGTTIRCTLKRIWR